MAAEWRLPDRVHLAEVGPRDGFQMEERFIPTQLKVEIIDRLSTTGLREIQATSFVHPRAIPQLADAEEVMARIQRRPGVVYTALAPNRRGAERALAAGVGRVEAFVSVSESHSRSNANMSTAEAMQRAGEVVALCRQAGVEVSIGFPTALGCPFEGFPAAERVTGLVRQAVEGMGLRRVSIADTAGMAGPRLVHDTMERLLEAFPEVTYVLHLHDTRRLGLANLLAGLEVGVRHFDTSLAGLGGCPYAPGATGNVATEDALNMLRGMGIETGVDRDAQLAAARLAAERLGHADSAVLRAGTSEELVGRYAGGQVRSG
jgi:hydroxymethylglutaryl-CoA lyase